jgi:phosphoribosylanthranilate isomerase
MVKKIPSDKIVICEATSFSTVKKLPKRVDAIIAGPKILKRNDLSKNIERLIGKPKPLIKICGIRSLEQAVYCQKMGADLIGLNFIPSNHRRISYQLGEQIIQKIRQDKKSDLKVVGVFQDHDLSEVNTAAEKLNLDFIQLSGGELISYVKKCKRPVIKEVSIVRKSSLNTAARFASSSKYISLDWARVGFDPRLLKKCAYPYFIGGEIGADNIRDLQAKLHPMGINVSKGIETEGEIDLMKIRKILFKK